MYSTRLAQDGITLELIDNDEEIPVIPCDPQRMRQVFLNILDNAAKHGGQGKRIETEMTFEDKLKEFMQTSDSRMSDLKHYTDRKNGSRRGRR